MGWLLIQIATQVFPFFEIPNWAVRVVVLVIAAGFPIAIVVAWAFEMTPSGLKRTEDVSPNEFVPQWSRRKFSAMIATVALLAGALLVFQIWRSQSEASAPTAPPAKSIAVLPFDNLSRDPDNAYFTEGVQEEIVTRLARIAAFKVIARGSTQQLKSTPQDLPQIAKELGARNVIEGSVQRADGKVRVNVQLINAATDTDLWAESYDRQTTDLFGVESDIAQAVVDTLNARLTGDERHEIKARPTENSEAHDLYLRGRFFWNKRTVAGFKTAITYFKQATDADPNYAAAYAGLADCYLLLPLYGGTAPADVYPEAREAAQRAVALDPRLGESYASLGLLNSFGFDFPVSVHDFEESIRLNPNYATAHQWFGDSTLPSLGQFERANTQMKRALELDPLSVVINDDVGYVYWLTGRASEAIVQLRKTLEMDPRAYYVHRDLGQALEATGDLVGAIAEYKKATQLDDDPSSFAFLGAAEAKAGDRAAADAILQQLEGVAKRRYVPDYFFALLHLALGEKDEALRFLQSSYAKHQPDLNTIRIDPNLRPLHGDARFEALAEKIVPARQFRAPAVAANR
ncbi:MAG: tetratricopeptide repeat protein [Chthoniobacterales bacterium]